MREAGQRRQQARRDLRIAFIERGNHLAQKAIARAVAAVEGDRIGTGETADHRANLVRVVGVVGRVLKQLPHTPQRIAARTLGLYL